jgi:hypothetical protein
MSLSGVNAGYLDVRNAILRVGTLDVQTIVSGVDTATNIAKTNTILLWDDQGSDMNSPPFILTSATRSTSPPYLELGGGVAHVGIKLPNAWLGAFEVYMSDTTDASIKLHTYTTDTTSYGDTGYELVLNSSGVTLNYDGAQVAAAAYTWTNDTWHQVVVGFERGAWTVSVDGTPTLIKDDIEREAVYANVGQYLRIDAASATTTKRVRYVKFAANGQWLQSNTGTLSYTQGNVVIGAQTTNYALDVRGTANVGVLTATSVDVTDTTHSTSRDTGAMVIANGGLGVESNIHTSNLFASGYVGIGITEPSRSLHVNGTAVISDYLNGELQVQGRGLNYSSWIDITNVSRSKALGQTEGWWRIQSYGTTAQNGLFSIQKRSIDGTSLVSEPFNIDKYSNVGIGTTNPAYKLDVNGTANVGAITMNSNVYAPNLQVADTASNLVTWNSATGDFMDSGGLISNKLAIVSEQPPAALTAATTTVNGHGKYSVYASNVATNSNAWNAFDQSSSVYWQSTGVYSGGVGGEYLKITFPYKTTLRHVVYTGASGAYTSWAKAANIAGSNDDSTWTQLASFSGFGPTSNDPKTMIVNATTSYKHYKFTITENSGSVNYATVAQLKLFTESFSVDGGIVTTTAASGLETGFTEHPVAPMTGFNTYVEGHGTYEASASSYNAAQSSAEPWRAFDYNTVTGSWRTTGFSNSTYLYTGPDVLVDAGGTRYNGPSLTIKIPYAIVLSHSTFNVWGGTFGYETSPKVGYIFGSNNGVDWYKLFYISDFGFEDVEGGNIKTVSINATTPYTHYAFVCTEKNNTGTATAMNLNEWRLFSATGVTKMDNVLISGELAVDGGALQTSHIKWPKVPLKANESEGYVASASSSDSAPGDAYRAFNDLTIGQGVEYWDTASTYSTSTGLHNNSVSTTDVDGLVQYGEWIQIKLPNQISLHSMKWYPRKYYASGDLESWPLQRVPKSGVIMGSNDGTNWYTLNSFSDISYTLAAYEEGKEVKVNNSKPFLYYRLVITSLNAGTGSNRAGLVELQLFESTLGVGTSATTAKLTVDGGLGLAKGSQVFAGSDVITEFPKHDRPLVKYPEVAMTANSSGGYVVDRSTVNNSGWEVWEMFNGIKYTSSDDGWHSANYVYLSATGEYDSTNKITDASGVDYEGEWTSIMMPKAVKLSYFKLYSRTNLTNESFLNRLPKDGTLLGSQDGTTWYKIYSFTDRTYQFSNKDNYFYTNSTKYYKHFVLVYEKLGTGYGGIDNSDTVNIGEWELYGTEEGDESVDIVHKSIPNKPGQQQLAVYYEARDPNSYSFADSSNVYDLSGNGVTGTITGNNGFDAEYNAWVFDGSGDYISTTSSGLGTGGAFDHSFAFWFKINRNITNNDYVVTFGEETNDNMIAVNISGNTLIHFDNWGTGVITGSVVTLGQWYHVACTHTGSATGDINNQLIYVNGVRQSTSATGTGTLAFTSNRITIGARPGTNNSNTPAAFLDGAVADVRFYKGKALNADQVRELYEYDAERFGHRQNLVALHKGNLGVGVTNPTSRFEVAGADGLQEYPPKAMTGDETYIEGHGVFRASASTDAYAHTGFAIWKAFNKVQGNEGWHSGEGYTYGGLTSPYSYITNTGGSVFDTANVYQQIGGISGQWIKLECPQKIILKSIALQNRTLATVQSPKDFTLLGSNNGGDWDILGSYVGVSSSTSGVNHEVNATESYKYFALVVTRLQTTTTGDCVIGEWRLFGTPAPSSLEDGHLTLGKALTLPRVSGHPAGAETPRAASLVVHYDTTVDSVVSGSTVVDISGEGNNGTLYGNTSYSSSTRSFDFDGLGADYVLKSSPSGLPTGDAIYSMSAWINTDSSIGSAGIIISFGSSWTSNNIASMYIRTGNQLGASTGGNLVYTTNAVLSYNTWHHVAITKKSTGAISTAMFDLYVDGTLITATTVSGTGTQNLGTITGVSVGMSFDGSSNEFHGKISKPKLWNVVLTAEEVGQEYALGRTGKSLNLTDTALCLGGTVPRAQLDVRGSARVDGRMIIGKTDNALADDPDDITPTLDVRGLDDTYIRVHSTASKSCGLIFCEGNNNQFIMEYEGTGGGAGNYVTFYSSEPTWSDGAKGLGFNYVPQSGKVGIGKTNPDARFHIKQTDLSYGNGIRFEHSTTTSYWDIFQNSNNDLNFSYNAVVKAFFDASGGDNVDQNFTGQHRTFIKDIPFSQAGDLEGLIVSSDQNKYIKMSGGIEAGSNAITTNESLPVVSLSTKVNDKKCFGVVSTSEDPETREEKYGNFVSVSQKELGDTRVYINSVGEGAMWVVNTAGPLESGDYITTSNVAGYGQRQDDDILHNYTVAKITMDCDFEPPDIPVQRILKELSNITYWYQLEDATSNAYDRTEEETYYTLDRRVEVYGHVDEQSNVFVEPVHDLELYTKTQENIVSEEVYNALPEDEQVLYDSNTFTYTQVTELVPDVWGSLDTDEQNTYVHGYFNIVTDEVPSGTPGAVDCTRTVYKKIVNETKVEPATPEDYFSEVRQEWVNVLDAHGQLQWEDVPWGETEPAYKVRYLDADGKITTRHNEVHRAAFVGVTYHCG